MAYFNEFPHTRTYDSDLGWLIRNVGQNIEDLTTLQAWAAEHKTEYEDLKNKVDGLIDNLIDVIVPWDSSKKYQVFSIVEYQGANYIAIQDVPVGVMITNTDYWVPANTVVEQLNAIGITVSDIRDTSPRMYSNVAEMIADANLRIGDYAETSGYYTAGDGGGALYLIADESIDFYETLNSGLYANLQITADRMSIRCYGAKTDGTNTTGQIQNAIDAYPNGMAFYFPKGKYMVTGLTMKLKTKFYGDGWGLTIISQIDGTDDTDIIKIPSKAQCCLLEGLTISGFNNSSQHKGAAVHVEEVSASAGSGILQLYNLTVDWTTAVDASYKFLIIHDVYMDHMNDGLFLDKCRYAVFVDTIHCYENIRYGIYDNGSTDNIFGNFYVERNGSDGIHTTGSNNKWYNGKVIWNNQTDYQSDNLNYETAEDNTAAFYIKGSRNEINNVECQDNCGHGWLVWGQANLLVNTLADSNGYMRKNSSDEIVGGIGYLIYYGAHIRIINATVDNYAYNQVINGINRTNACRIAYFQRHPESNADCIFDISTEHCIIKTDSYYQNNRFYKIIKKSMSQGETVEFSAPDRNLYLIFANHPSLGNAIFMLITNINGGATITVPIVNTNNTVVENIGGRNYRITANTVCWLQVIRIGSYAVDLNLAE